MDVVVAFDEGAGVGREAHGECRVVEQAGDGVGEGGRVVGRGEQAGVAIAHEFGDADDVCADARGAERHGFDEDGRQAVAVAVSADDAGGDEHRRLPDVVFDFCLAAVAEEAHAVFQVQAGDVCGECLALVTVADDVAGAVYAAFAQGGDGVYEVGEAFFFDEAADGEEVRRAVFGRVVGELFEVESVVDAVHGRFAGVLFAQVGEVVVGDGDGEGGVGDFAGEVHRFAVFVVDVFGVCGDAVGDGGKARGEAGDGRRLGAEVGVQVADAAFVDFERQYCRLADGGGAVVFGKRGVGVEGGQGGVGFGEQLPVEFGVVVLVADAAHRRAHAGDGFLEVGFLYGA